MPSRERPSPRIAVIGAGPADCTLARLLLLETTLQAENISIFEREASLHGRLAESQSPRTLVLGYLPRVLAEVRADGSVPRVVSVEIWQDRMAALRERKGQGKEGMAETVAREYVRVGDLMFSLEGRVTKKALEGLGWNVEECPPDAAFLRELLGMGREA